MAHNRRPSDDILRPGEAVSLMADSQEWLHPLCQALGSSVSQVGIRLTGTSGAPACGHICVNQPLGHLSHSTEPGLLSGACTESLFQLHGALPLGLHLGH